MAFALLFFICISLFIEASKGLAIPRPIKNSPLGALTGRSSHVTFFELAFYIISLSAILFCIVGAFVLSIVGGARVLLIMERFPRGATIRNAIRRLPPPFIMAGQGAGQIPLRRPPVRRGGPAPPVAGLPRGHGRQWRR